MRLRVWAAGTALAVATTFGGGAILTAVDASTASAARPAHSPVSSSAPCTVANAVGSVASTCTVTLTKLSAVNGVLQGSGTVTGTDPAGNSFSLPFAGAPLADPAACPILSL